MEWAQQVGVTYCARVTPSAPLISIGSANRQFVLEYNMEYNFTVVAIAPCRPNVTTIRPISYGEVLCMYYTELYAHSITLSINFCIAKCGHPELVSNDSVPKVVGCDDIIPVEGTTIKFSCPPGLVIIGPNSASCMKNGEWEPDPSGVTCNDSKGKSILNLHQSIL